MSSMFGGNNMERRRHILPLNINKLISASNPGSLMYITAAGTGILVLNSHKAANDLLDRRANNYSDRPRMISM